MYEAIGRNEQNGMENNYLDLFGNNSYANEIFFYIVNSYINAPLEFLSAPSVILFLHQAWIRFLLFGFGAFIEDIKELWSTVVISNPPLWVTGICDSFASHYIRREEMNQK